MSLKDKIKQSGQIVTDTIKENKIVIIIGTVVGITMMVLLMNLNLVQMTYYKIQGDSVDVQTLVQKGVNNKKHQDDLYFKMGIDFLLEDLSEESKIFFEQHFSSFIPEVQIEIIESYNANKLLFKSSKDIVQVVGQGGASPVYKEYLNNMDIKELEKNLKLYFGEKPKISQDTVTQMHNVLSMQSKKLTMEVFKFSLYDIMSFPHNGDLQSTALKMLDYVEPEAIRQTLFTELKTRPIDMEVLNIWVDILSKKGIISNKEYAEFANNYNDIKRVREEYKTLLLQEVDLINLKQTIDVQTGELVNQASKYTKEIETIKAQIVVDTQELSEIKKYRAMEFYILDQYANGEYDAAIPEKSWLFGTYKPGEQKLRLKTTRTTVDKLGVMTFDVYEHGTQDGIPYFVEVSQDDLTKIQECESKIQASNTLIVEKTEAINKLNAEIGQVRKLNNYEQTLELIKGIEDKKLKLELEIQAAQVAIQNMFNIGQLIVPIQINN